MKKYNIPFEKNFTPTLIKDLNGLWISIKIIYFKTIA